MRFLAAAEHDFTFLAEFPHAGVKRRFRRKELADIHSWPIGGFTNHVIFHRPIVDGIEIIRVLYGTRDVEAILGS